MIDCHAHAYPDLGERAPQLGAMLGAPRRLHEWLSRQVGLPLRGVERIAQLRERPEGPVRQLVDLLISGVAAPGVIGFGTADSLVASMDRHAISRSLLIAAPPFATNAWVIEQCRRSAGRLVPVVCLPDLTRSAPERAWVDDLDRLAADGARGFKIHPNMDGLEPDHVAYRAMFEVARARGLFVILHTGHFQTLGYRRPGPAEPEAYADFFTAFPEVRVCLAHMNRDRPEGAWELLRRFEQLFTDTSWQPAGSIRRAVDQVGAARILLGSDWPLLHGDLQGEVLAIARDALSDADLQQVGCDNPPRFLGEDP